jgi:ATP-binding cassette subfamily B protein RaxB
MTMLDLGLWGRRRVEHVRQTELAECGLACLAMIAAYHGLRIDLGSLRRTFSPSARGSTLRSMVSISDTLGLSSRAVKVDVDRLDHLQLPAILHWDLSHFVVLEQVTGRKARVHDPAGGSRWISLAELGDHFTGVALELRPSIDFESGDRRERLRLSQLWTGFVGLKRALFQLLVLSLVLQAYVVGAPYYLRVAVDSAVPAFDLDLVLALALGFGLFAVVNAGASLLRTFVILSAATQLGFALSVNLARRLLRLPVAWFERRHVGDILSRFQSITPIQQALTTGPVTALLDGLLAAATLVMMFLYSGMLGSLALFGFAVYAVVKVATFRLQRRAQESLIVTGGRAQTNMIESIRGISTLRLFNKEGTRLAIWQSAFAEATNATFGYYRIQAWQDFANVLVFGVEGILSMAIAVSFVIKGGFTLGMLFAFAAYKGQFILKASSCLDQYMLLKMLDLHLERLSDIAGTPEDAGFSAAAESPRPLAGGLELRGIVHRYAPADPVVLDHVDLSLAPGDHVAITGPSGGGKSTLAKILLGLVQPEHGELLVDGVPLSLFGYKSYHSQVAAVLQDDNLFGGTLADNIALFDDDPDFERIVEAATAAAIHEDIERMPMRYETLVGDMGSALSGGQKQRVLLARALYRRPRILIMDEGTSHLDSEHERRVNASIAQLGITRIVIAHRAETIAAADRVLLLTGGRLHPATAEMAAAE